MKQITNWRNATVFDVEADGLLDTASLLHVLSCTMENGDVFDIEGDDLDRIRAFLEYHIENGIPVVAHNGICYDIPLLGMVLDIDLSDLMVIDSLVLSWYLNHDRDIHGLNSFYDDYGHRKLAVEDDQWEGVDPEGLSEEEYLEKKQEHYELMRLRCNSDIVINKSLWEDLQARLINMYTIVKDNIDNGLVDGRRTSDEEVTHLDSYKGTSTVDEYIDRILTYLMFKQDCVRLQEKTGWETDKEGYQTLESELNALLANAQEELEGVMPWIPDYGIRNPPSQPYKQDRSLSANGIKWNERVEKVESGEKDEYGNLLAIAQDDGTIKELIKLKPPNVNSPLQIKDWLFSYGWKPKTFKYVKDKKATEAWADSGFRPELKPEIRKVPQINTEGDEGKELCPSVVKLSEKIPEIMAYSKYTLIKHRRDMVKGFLETMGEGRTLKARVGGYTNTLRMKHRELYNLPSVSKPYGEKIRGGLIAKEGNVLEGSDLSALEDRIKSHFCKAYDPEYLETINVEGFDPHIFMCKTAGMISEEDYELWLGGVKTERAKEKRPLGKTASYSCVYGAGAATIAQSADIPLKEAEALHKAYWKIHAYVKDIADDQCIIRCKRGHNWIINPINGFCYSVRTEKDIFSTLIQGSGAFMFDMWVDNILTEMYDRWGVKTLTGQFHDEFIISIKDDEEVKKLFDTITQDAIMKVNRDYKLRFELGCDVSFGYKYSEIH